MKYNRILLNLIFCLTSFMVLGQQQSFNYKRKLNVTQEGWHTIKLPADIFVHCDEAFNDLRLYSIAGTDTTEVPYLLKKRITRVNDRELDLSAINKSMKGDILFITFELKGEKVNQINLEFEETNYFAFVKIEGSDDKNEWFEIINHQRIFSIQNSNASFHYTEVPFPVASYEYLRVSVEPDKPVKFKRGTFRHQETDKGKFEEIPLTWNTKDYKKDQQTITEIRFDHYRPLSNLKVEIENDNDYYRSCYIETLTDSTKTEKGWIRNYRQVGGGYLTSSHENGFDLMDVRTSMIRVIIINQDNAPLYIKNVSAQGHTVELIANLKAANNFLFYGKRFATAPNYDLAYFEEKIPATTAVATLDVEENISVPQAQLSALFENKVWLWVVMILVIALLGFFTLKMMKGKSEVSS